MISTTNNRLEQLSFTSIGMPSLNSFRNLDRPSHGLFKDQQGSIRLFSTRDIDISETVAETPIQTVQGQELKILRKLGLSDLCFDWRSEPEQEAVAFGAGAFIGHSEEPNCNWRRDYTSNKIVIYPRRHIYEGEPLCIDYRSHLRWRCSDLTKDGVQKRPLNTRHEKPRAIAAPVQDYGRGLIATTQIKPRQTIVAAPVRVIPQKDLAEFAKITTLVDYAFEWGKTSGVVLGLPSMVNHSEKFANAYFVQNWEDRTIALKAEKTINPGEEIYMNYNGVDESGVLVERARPYKMEPHWINN